MHEHLDKTWKRLKKDFGSDSTACAKIGKKRVELGNEVSDSENDLRELLSKNILGAIYKAPVGGHVINLKSVFFVILENSFGWLNKAGQMQELPLTTREVPLSPEVRITYHW